ncbi:MAG: NAD(P)-dependent oxidoreductase [Candidatus Hodarchaeales archaeon]|jgi:phosphoglycerate dehydrogenase-like enzyme
MHGYQDTVVLFTWDVNDRLKSYLQEHLDHAPKLDLIFPEEVSEENLLELAPRANIMVGWRVPDQIKLAAKKMQLYINPGVGIKHHIEFFRKLNQTREVILINGHGNSYFTAQHVVAMLLALMNKIISHNNWMKSGLWRRGDADAISLPLRYRKVGLLGYGAINKKVHRFLQGFNIEFSILRCNWSKNEDKMPTNAKKYLPNDLLRFLEEIDILIVAVPETTKTIGMIRKEEMKSLGTNGLLVNVSRGSVVDEKSLFHALQKKELAGAAIDVWYNYNPDPDKEGRKYPFTLPFHTLDNIVLSPHRAASPFNDLERWDEVIENILRFNQGKRTFLNVVDLENEY